MPSLPRIITVDVSGTIARIVRAAADLTDRPVRILDVPSGPEALEELQHGGCDLVVTAWELYDDRMRGLQLAIQVAQTAPGTGIIILGDVDDPDPTDELVSEESPFIYMRRPVDIHQFVRVLMAGLDGEEMRAALQAPVTGGVENPANFGPVPSMDLKKAQAICDSLQRDLNAMAIVLASREGEVLLSRGQTGALNAEKMTSALLPMIMTTIHMKEMVGGQASSLQYYDGQDFDVFVLSAGLHHFLCIVFDGEQGARQFGAVNRFGRRASEDLIGLLGANAFIIQPPTLVQEEAEKQPARTQPRHRPKTVVVEDDVPLARAQELAAPPVPEPEPVRLDPIPELDLSIFDGLGDLDENLEDDLFDPDKLAELVNQLDASKSDNKLSLEDAERIGLIGGSNQ